MKKLAFALLALAAPAANPQFQYSDDDIVWEDRAENCVIDKSEDFITGEVKYQVTCSDTSGIPASESVSTSEVPTIFLYSTQSGDEQKMGIAINMPGIYAEEDETMTMDIRIDQLEAESLDVYFSKNGRFKVCGLPIEYSDQLFYQLDQKLDQLIQGYDLLREMYEKTGGLTTLAYTALEREVEELDEQVDRETEIYKQGICQIRSGYEPEELMAELVTKLMQARQRIAIRVQGKTATIRLSSETGDLFRRFYQSARL